MAKEKQFTTMQKAFLDALFGEAEGDLKAAKNAAGYSAATSMHEVIDPIRDEIVERASSVLAVHAPKAAFSMIGVMDAPAQLGARNIVTAAAQVLDRAGVVKKEQVEVTAPEGGIFILPPKKTEPVADD